MKNHTKTYINYFGYQIPSDCVCEICGAPAVDIHHIEARGMGGSPSGEKDKIENLMAICRNDHVKYGDVPEFKQLLKDIHLKFMQINKKSK